MKKIALIAERTKDLHDLYRGILEEFGFRCVFAQTDREALDAVLRHRYDLVISCYRFSPSLVDHPDAWREPALIDGLGLFELLRERWGTRIPFLLITGAFILPSFPRDSGNWFYLEKPFGPGQLQEILQRVLQPR